MGCYLLQSACEPGATKRIGPFDMKPETGRKFGLRHIKAHQTRAAQDFLLKVCQRYVLSPALLCLHAILTASRCMKLQACHAA